MYSWEDLPYIEELTQNDDFSYWEFLNVQGPSGRASYLVSCSQEDSGNVIVMYRNGQNDYEASIEVSPLSWLTETTEQMRAFSREMRAQMEA